MSMRPEKGSLLRFSNIVTKLLQLPLCSIVMQNVHILYWVPVMLVVTCFWVALVKNRRGILDHGTLKSAGFQESELIK